MQEGAIQEGNTQENHEQESQQEAPLKETMLQHLLVYFFETQTEIVQVPRNELEHMMLENYINNKLLPMLEHFFKKDFLYNEENHKKILEYSMRIFQINQSLITMEEEGNTQLICYLQSERQLCIKKLIFWLYRNQLFSTLDEKMKPDC